MARTPREIAELYRAPTEKSLGEVVRQLAELAKPHASSRAIELVFEQQEVLGSISP